MAKVMDITDDTFSGVIMKDQPTLVLFHAPWSGHAQLMLPTMESIAEEQDATALCNAQAELSVSTIAKFGIRTVPTLALFKKGRLLGVRIGLQSRKQVVEFIAETTNLT